MGEWSRSLFVVVTRVSYVCLLLLALPGWSQSLPLSIRVHTESGTAITGATIQVERDGNLTAKVLTDAEGKAAIAGLSIGQYNILVSAETFEQAVQLVLIRDERQEIEVDFTLLSKLRRTDSIDVVADAGTVETANAMPVAAEIRTAETMLLPSRPATVTDTLPLVPGVNRSP